MVQYLLRLRQNRLGFNLILDGVSLVSRAGGVVGREAM